MSIKQLECNSFVLIKMIKSNVIITHTLLVYADTHTPHHHHTYTFGTGTHKKNEGNVLFNDTLNTFYSLVYGIGHMVKDHSVWGNPLLLFPNSSKASSICTIPDRIAHTTAFVIPVVEDWLEQEIAEWVHQEELIWQPIAPRSYISLLHTHTQTYYNY